MQKWLLLIGLAVAISTSAGGCRSCSNCHDYDPPVANCGSNGCACHRAGSVSQGPASGEASYVTGPYETEYDPSSTAGISKSC
jgi:hypothetical protein